METTKHTVDPDSHVSCSNVDVPSVGGALGEEEVVVGEGVVVTSSSLEMLTNNYLGGIMVSLIFLEGLDEEALVEFMMVDSKAKRSIRGMRPLLMHDLLLGFRSWLSGKRSHDMIVQDIGLVV
ncbi:hypothetical protein Tco_0778880 [Tanacetum coccineum]